MKTMKILIFALAVALLVPSGAFAQTATYQTVTAVALNSTSTTFSVGSVTNMSATTATSQQFIFCDGELMQINAINTSTKTLTVRRGVSPTNAGSPPYQGTHPTATICWFGPSGGSTGSPFITQNPQPGTACTATSFAFLPLVNVQNNSLANCVGSRWRNNTLAMYAFSRPVTAVNNVAYTATLADDYIVYTNLSTARTVTLPPITGVLGHRVRVKNLSADGTDQITVAAVNGQGIGTIGTETFAITAGAGQAMSFISVISSSGAWTWTTE